MGPGGDVAVYLTSSQPRCFRLPEQTRTQSEATISSVCGTSGPVRAEAAPERSISDIEFVTFPTTGHPKQNLKRPPRISNVTPQITTT